MPAAISRYNRYDTALVCLFALRKEHLVPDHLRSIVPHSTASRWRTVQVTSLIGHELRSIHQEALDFHELLARYKRLRSTVLVLAKVWARISDIVLPFLHRQKEHAERVVGVVQLLFTILPRRKVFRLVRLSPSAFHERVQRTMVRCGLSPIDRCFKRHPLQLALSEVGAIKQLFAAGEHACWPAASLYWHGVRQCTLRLSLGKFYKYVALLGLQRRWARAPRKDQGLVATMPDQYLHVDTTFWPIDGGAQAAIALVSDNFSKAVIGSSVAAGKHAANIVAALRAAVATIQRVHPAQASSVLVADGGSEKRAVCVDELLASEDHPAITRIIAQKDITFSNSPIEAINKILKRYLRHHKPTSLAGVARVVELFQQDYGFVRPHASLKGLTPYERYTDPSATLPVVLDAAAARAQRIEENRKLNCSFAPDGSGSCRENHKTGS